MDRVFRKPEIIIIDGKYGSGYIYSIDDAGVVEPIHINFRSIKEWFQEGCVKIVATNDEHYLTIPNTIPWKLIVEWCKCGAYTSYWND
jgi:hypothetical protein